jgi:hypothetical protein
VSDYFSTRVVLRGWRAHGRNSCLGSHSSPGEQLPRALHRVVLTAAIQGAGKRAGSTAQSCRLETAFEIRDPHRRRPPRVKIPFHSNAGSSPAPRAYRLRCQGVTGGLRDLPAPALSQQFRRPPAADRMSGALSGTAVTNSSCSRSRCTSSIIAASPRGEHSPEPEDMARVASGAVFQQGDRPTRCHCRRSLSRAPVAQLVVREAPPRVLRRPQRSPPARADHR